MIHKNKIEMLIDENYDIPLHEYSYFPTKEEWDEMEKRTKKRVRVIIHNKGKDDDFINEHKELIDEVVEAHLDLSYKYGFTESVYGMLMDYFKDRGVNL